jgi:hypothetical protein
MEEALFAHLMAAEPLTALIGVRVEPNEVPKGLPMPAVHYRLVSAPRIRTKEQATEVVEARFELGSWADGYDTAKAVDREVVRALRRWRGAGSGVRIVDCIIETQRDQFNAETQRHGRLTDVKILYQETT